MKEEIIGCGFINAQGQFRKYALCDSCVMVFACSKDDEEVDTFRYIRNKEELKSQPEGGAICIS